MKQVRLILVGGFLGAGKTTLIVQAARRLAGQGNRVGLITNDQAPDMVDTGIVRREGFGVQEVAGGCFCCRFDELVSATDRLLSELKPNVLLGEPVGSCTDLSATVLQPMKKLYAEWFRVAPFSVLTDPARLREALGGKGSAFPDSVMYIFRKQLEEADLIVINKADLLSAEDLAALKAAVAAKYPKTPVMTLSALKGGGVEEWLEFVMQDRAAGTRLAEVDYDTYAEGEAVLGWLNASVHLTAEGGADWRALATDLLERLRGEFARLSAEVAHVKLLLTAVGGSLTANLTSTGAAPSVQGEVQGSPREAVMILNARVHMDPDALRGVIERCLKSACGAAVSAELTSVRNFSPARPQPTHRFGSVVS